MIKDCPHCGGIHYGSYVCPFLEYNMPPFLERALEHPPMIIKPTIGRVVWFRPAAHEKQVVHDGQQPCVAFVTFVHSDTLVNVAGFDANGVPFVRTSMRLKQDDPGATQPLEGESYVEWMPYQVGQAKKHEGDALDRR